MVSPFFQPTFFISIRHPCGMAFTSHGNKSAVVGTCSTGWERLSQLRWNEALGIGDLGSIGAALSSMRMETRLPACSGIGNEWPLRTSRSRG